ncbi:MAG TPA: cob(I)yrinic acid a,c-diamide adenosyltransferase [Patescibacteria group bacterium]|nr:cob(I)yrinic acid a,c-diamide adenosyltransferase [Patescibacteria group bacterium]
MQKQITNQGLVMLNIGAGKGKTTAAVGTALRAAGAGMNVLILQFVKARKAEKGKEGETGEWPISCEMEILNHVAWPRGFGRIENRQLGLGFVGILGDKKQKEAHIKAAIEGLGIARKEMVSGKWDLMILDELVSAVEVEVLTEQDVVDLLSYRPPQMHVILTGHNKYEKIIKACDMVTDMKMVKHPYYMGILAQRGIDF